MHVAPLHAGRIVRLDTARLSAVLAVIVLHAAAAYTLLIPWWYVTPRETAPAFDVLIIFLDGWIMPLLFAIAGYFSWPSLRRRGPAGFLAGRLRRLGWPLVGLTLGYCPLIGYLDRQNKGLHGSFGDYWLGLLPSLGDWRLRVLTGQENLAASHGQFGPYHLWFLGLLLLWSGLLAIGVFASRATGRVGFTGAKRLAWTVGLAMLLAEAWAQARIPDAAWVQWGPFFVCQVARLPLYLGFFLLGVLAWQGDGFGARSVPGPLWAWVAATLLTFVALIAGGAAVAVPGPKSWILPFGYGLARTAFALAASGVVLRLCTRNEHRAGAVTASLTRSSFDLYLLHMPLVVWLQYLLATASLSLYAKCALVLTLATVLAWLGSRLVAGRPWYWRVLGIAALFGLCLLAWGV